MVIYGLSENRQKRASNIYIKFSPGIYDEFNSKYVKNRNRGKEESNGTTGTLNCYKKQTVTTVIQMRGLAL